MSAASKPGSVPDSEDLRYWLRRALRAELELEKCGDQLDSANERIAQLEQQRKRDREWQENGLTGRPYWRFGVGR